MRQPENPPVEHDSGRPRGELRTLHVYLLFFFWTLFSVFLYTRFSTLGDSESYLTGAYDEDGRQLRTLLITKLAELVFAVVHNDLLSHLVFSAFAASGVVYLIKNAKLHDRYRWPVLAILCTPNFGVWASVIGRESLFVGLLGYFLGAVLGYWRRPSLHRMLLAIVCVSGMTFIRSPYGLGLSLFLLMFLAYRSGPKIQLSAGVQALVFAVVCGFILMLVWPHLDAYIADDVLPKAKRYFSLSSDTTRTWVQVDTTAKLLTGLWWSLPLALVGPTPAEVMARPLILPFFLSGVVVFGSLLYSVGVAFRAPRGRPRKILLLGWLPAVIFILIAYVPFGIYNSGSAIRYSSCLLLFLVFPHMLLSVLSAEAEESDDFIVAAMDPTSALHPMGGPSVDRPAFKSR
jgi:hypothetical protein